MKINGYRYLLTIFTILMLIFGFSVKTSAQEAVGTFTIKNIVTDSAGRLLFLSGNKQNEKITYRMVKLSAPDRLVIDFMGAVLVDDDGKKIITINNKKFKEEVRIAQFSTNPNIVRIVFAMNSPNSADSIKINPYQNGAIIEFDKIELAMQQSPSIYKDRDVVKPSSPNEIVFDKADSASKNATLSEIQEKVQNNIVIKNIQFKDNRVLLSGTGLISITEPFILNTPNRIIFDLSDAVLESSSLIQSYNFKNKDIARIAQFDEKTVRVVIESSKPEKYTPIVSPDLQSIVIVPKNEISFSEFPDNTSFGGIQKIRIIKENNLTTQILIIAEKPIIHSLENYSDPQKLVLNMYNINPPPPEFLKSIENTPQFHGFQVKNTAWELELNRTTTIESQLSLDGRILKITLQDVLTCPVIASAPLKARIILDPGHGGYDPGAQYKGVFEKDIVLDITRRTKKYLDAMGLSVLMTRDTDKTVSLKERCDITNSHKPYIFVSIHANASNNAGIKGIETHWYTPQSKNLAVQIQNQLAKDISAVDRGLKNSRFYVIRNTEVPAVLVETGYMSNDVEMYQLMSDERRDATARAIANAIADYIRLRVRR